MKRTLTLLLPAMAVGLLLINTADAGLFRGWFARTHSCSGAPVYQVPAQPVPAQPGVPPRDGYRSFSYEPGAPAVGVPAPAYRAAPAQRGPRDAGSKIRGDFGRGFWNR